VNIKVLVCQIIDSAAAGSAGPVPMLMRCCCEIFQKVDDLWDLLDTEGTTFMPYDDFMRHFLGEMNEYRKFVVIKVQYTNCVTLLFAMHIFSLRLIVAEGHITGIIQVHVVSCSTCLRATVLSAYCYTSV